MAKAVFHKHQRVFVGPVGTWALVEQVKPHWVKDVEEPIRIAYDCGLGRDFTADELAAEQADNVEAGHWRVLRAKNKWQTIEECAGHPFPGTFPVVVTEAMDWGGWRVPAAEYDRDPHRIEAQGRLLANSPRLLEIAEQLAAMAGEDGDLPPALAELSRSAERVLRDINTKPAKAGNTPQSRAA
ncbi:MAG: hypothetical protein ACJAU5_000941 [Maricaulis maris]|jgi:hypothetical protein|uniref:hypothetical protein n=1 Tax=Maricaulis TaxID=74317 RepID=UPI000C3EE50E|nr:hypothetical protein [Maricaulis sp.]MAC90710.1 hypothetical protein [Maricaulis sp.]